jgi:hypothetical protein
VYLFYACELNEIDMFGFTIAGFSPLGLIYSKVLRSMHLDCLLPKRIDWMASLLFSYSV